MPALPQRDEPIHVLVVIAAPDDQERLALRQEVQTLIEDLELRLGSQFSSTSADRNGVQTIDLKLTILEQPGRPELAHALEQGQFQVFHYAGHSDVSETGGELYLVNRQTGLTDWLSGEDLAGLLVNNGIRLAVFNSCRGAYTAADDVDAGWREQNLVQALVNRGVPAVVAMAERIPDDVAVTFTRLLYRNLQRGYAIDLCLSRVRQGLISAYRSDQPYWMLPILYLHPDFNGYLYTHPAAVDGEQEVTPLNLTHPLDPPDYSTDPHISGLAQEILASHGATALPMLDLESDGQETELPEADATTVDYPLSQQGHEQNSPAPSEPVLPDLLNELDQCQDADPQGDASAVTRLVQQLSHPPDQNQDPPDANDPIAVQDEDLLPNWPPTSTDLRAKIPDDPQQFQGSSDRSSHHSSPWKPSGLSQDSAGSPRWIRPRTIPNNIVVWIGLGLVSLVAMTALAMAVLSRSVNHSSSPRVITPAPNTGEVPPTNEPDLNIVGRDSAVITAALAALTEDRPETAAKFIHQLLDQGDLEAAASVVGQAQPDQFIEPELAFARGRLLWQGWITGRGPGSPYDAQRDWAAAVKADRDFLDAWVALGFVNYTLGDFHGALEAWQTAVDIERRRLQDTDPTGQVRFSSEFAMNTYVGLAMVNEKLSEVNPVDQQQAYHQQQAKIYLDQVVTIQPKLLNPETLALGWIWTPELIQAWQTTIERITVSD
jgi:tetratricopeptide (TPR) repeat protein